MTKPLEPHAAPSLADAVEAVLDVALVRVAGPASVAPAVRLAVRAAFQRILLHHRVEFARARKPAGSEDVVAALARGEFAVGRPRPDVNLWEDVALAALIARHDAAATERFRQRFAARVGGWQNRYSRGVRYECDEFLADLLLPRERAGPRIESYAGHGPFDGWLQQVYMSLCHKRREQGQAHAAGRGGAGRAASDAASADDAAADVLSRTAGADETPDERFARLECADRLGPLIRESLDVLAPDERMILLMAVVDEVPQKSIAELYGLREYKVTRLKQAAIRRVAEAFRGLAGPGAQLTERSVRECVELLLQRFPAA